MYKFLTALLVILSIWGIARYRKTISAYDRQIADLEYVIEHGEHCLSVCEEKFMNDWGC